MQANIVWFREWASKKEEDKISYRLLNIFHLSKGNSCISEQYWHWLWHWRRNATVARWRIVNDNISLSFPRCSRPCPSPVCSPVATFASEQLSTAAFIIRFKTVRHLKRRSRNLISFGVHSVLVEGTSNLLSSSVLVVGVRSSSKWTNPGLMSAIGSSTNTLIHCSRYGRSGHRSTWLQVSLR